MDALDKGKATTRGGKVADTMPTGSQFIKKKQIYDESGPAMALGGKAGISFQLLKKGNKGKMEAKQFFVPTDTNLAAIATKQDDAAARERDIIKKPEFCSTRPIVLRLLTPEETFTLSKRSYR
jgi:regulator of nonsense transcripts 2